MTLADWIKARTTVQRFAAAINAPKSSVYAWVAGERIPRKQAMERIVAATRGAVRPSDFYEIGVHHVRTATPKSGKSVRHRRVMHTQDAVGGA